MDDYLGESWAPQQSIQTVQARLERTSASDPCADFSPAVTGVSASLLRTSGVYACCGDTSGGQSGRTSENNAGGIPDGGGASGASGGGGELLPAFNVEEAINRCMGNVQLLGKMLDKFQERSIQDMQQLIATVSKGDAKETAQLAHAIKGMAANLSAPRLRDLAAELEAISRQGDMSHIETHLQQMRAELDRCLQAIPDVLVQVGQKRG